MDGTDSTFGLASPHLLEKIDQLFACNVGEYIDLPQLVVVGHQSSGKSSVLEALTNLPFPRDSSLCTKYATQITFRRSPERNIAASIFPAPDASEQHKENVQSWTKKELQSLDPSSFANLMAEVNTLMGVVPGGPGITSTFSSDVLRLEISGPQEDHLSVIDVPGIFRKTTVGLTTKLDMDMVEQMVYNYMKNPRSVMLTVVPANVDVATQEILEKAEEVDPDGIRTLGILTKPDLVDKGAEKDVVALIEGRKHQLTLGWHALRNAGQAELGSPLSDRHAAERSFFESKTPWNHLEKDKVGIESLRSRLQEILATHIRREFPKVKLEINKKLKLCREGLQALGPKRQTAAEQSRFLTEISMEFQRVSAEALSSNFGRTSRFDENQNLRLATAVVNRSELMSDMIANKGHMFDFETRQEVKDSEAIDMAVISLDDPGFKGTIDVRKSKDHPELEEIVQGCEKVPEPRQGGIYNWLERVFRESRGFELGTLNPSLLAVTMKRQSLKWTRLAMGYIFDVVTMVHTFVLDLLHLICPIERVRTGLVSLLMDHLVQRYQKAISHVEFLLEIELKGTPATLNHYFNDNLEKCRQLRMKESMSSKSFSGCNHGTVVRLEDIVQNHPMSNAEHTIQDLHDILQSYYKVARKRFVDSLRMQAADHYLVTGPNSPLMLFSPTFVNDMTSEQLEEVAGEDVVVKRRRVQLEKENQELENGKKILN